MDPRFGDEGERDFSLNDLGLGGEGGGLFRDFGFDAFLCVAGGGGGFGEGLYRLGFDRGRIGCSGERLCQFWSFDVILMRVVA